MEKIFGPGVPVDAGRDRPYGMEKQAPYPGRKREYPVYAKGTSPVNSIGKGGEKGERLI